MATEDFKWAKVQGVDCIVWMFDNVENPTRQEKKRRKVLKQKVGCDNLETPMLDCKGSGSGLEYCDVIIKSDNIDAWHKAMDIHFKSHDKSQKIISGGYQVAFCSRDIAFTVNFYNSTKKLMVQPDKMEEQHLFKWLKHFDTLNDTRLGILKGTHKPTETEQVIIPDLPADNMDVSGPHKAKILLLPATNCQSTADQQTDGTSVGVSVGSKEHCQQSTKVTAEPPNSDTKVTAEPTNSDTKVTVEPTNSDTKGTAEPTNSDKHCHRPSVLVLSAEPTNNGEGCQQSAKHVLSAGPTNRDMGCQQSANHVPTSGSIQQPSHVALPPLVKEASTLTMNSDSTHTSGLSPATVSESSGLGFIQQASHGGDATGTHQDEGGDATGTQQDEAGADSQSATPPVAPPGDTVPPPGAATLPVVNELLCFIQNKLDTMPRDILVKLCFEFYSQDSISKGKHVLFDATPPDFRHIKRHIKRRGPEKSREDLNDIMRLFLQIDPGKGPLFVAKDLSQLPPLSIKNFDILKVARDVEEIKQNLKMLTDCQSDTSALLHMHIVQKQPLTMNRYSQDGTAVTPPGDTMPPSSDVVTLSGDVVTSPGNVVTPSGDVVTHSTDVVNPPGDVVIPSGDVMTPPGDVVTPSGDVMTPPGAVVTPPGDVVIPPGDVEIPSGDVMTAPANIEIGRASCRERV
jgi:hypothetical protein